MAAVLGIINTMGAIAEGPTTATPNTQAPSSAPSPAFYLLILAGVIGGVLMTKGNDIRLNPGTILRIRFERELVLPVLEN